MRAAAWVRNVHSNMNSPMFDFRRIVLWLIVLLVPGGLLLLPALVADLRRGRPRPKPPLPSSTLGKSLDMGQRGPADLAASQT
jgi:hypothetical protein